MADAERPDTRTVMDRMDDVLNRGFDVMERLLIAGVAITLIALARVRNDARAKQVAASLRSGAADHNLFMRIHPFSDGPAWRAVITQVR